LVLIVWADATLALTTSSIQWFEPELQLAVLQAGGVDQVLNQALQPGSLLQNAANFWTVLIRAPLQQLGVAANDRQGVAQLVRRERQKVVLHPLQSPPFSDVAGNRRGANELPLAVPNRGDGQGHLNQRAVLAQPDSLELVDPLAPSEAGHDDAMQLVDSIRGDQPRDRLADHLVGGVAIESLGGGVPTGDHAVNRLADNGVVGRVNNGR
jgi:hypothetical protein